jgi:hypothetical protein
MVLAVIVVTEASASPRRAPPPPPPIERNCQKASSWEAAHQCIDTAEKGAKILELSADVRRVIASGARQYLFARIGAEWRLVFQLGDENYELVDRTTLTVRKQPAVRIDLSHHVAIGNDGFFLERVTLVCPEALEGCQALVTACTVTMRGRAVETFRGELKLTGDGVGLVGDRSYTGQYCHDR